MDRDDQDATPARTADASAVRAALEAERARTYERADALRRDVRAIIESTDLVASDDEHDPEGTTAFERAQAQALLEAAETKIAELDAALGRLADGTYGRCAGCGEPIAPARLEARPAARTCIACAKAR